MLNFKSFKNTIHALYTYTLIQNEKADLGQTEFTSWYKIIQSARCSHNNVNLVLKWPHKKDKEKESSVISNHSV